MDKDKVSLEFSVNIYGELEKYNEVISKGRCRIFYKGPNRNGTYITEDFANDLLSTVSYAPVKGIFDISEEDFSDHGEKRSLGRIYGVVPENPNLTWEKHLDDDGVEREYACVDVLIFTGLYKEAEKIIGKSQSMELYDKSIDGSWQIINGQKYFVFTKGCFLGLQVLGDDVEPCFEGASFFSLIEPLTKLLEDYTKQQNQIGGPKMDKLNFKLSDNAKFDAIWTLLNVHYNEENNWFVDYSICDVYDDYALVRNYGENCFERVYYTKDDETNSVVLGEREKVYIVDVSESEKNALEALRKINANANTYELIAQDYQFALDNQIQNSQKIEELNELNSTLTTERDNIQATYDALKTEKNELDEKYSQLEQENQTLEQYKYNVEKAKKQEVIDSYTDKLSNETIEKFTANIDSYEKLDLEKELAFALVQENPAVFNKSTSGYIPKEEPKSGLEEILSKYKK